MKVKIIDRNSEEFEKEFIVLSVHMSNGKGHVRIIIDKLMPDVPSYYPIESLETINSDIPPNWIIKTKNGNMDIIPKTWDDNLWEFSFWEQLFDGSIKASEIFYEELINTYKFHMKDEFEKPFKVSEYVSLRKNIPYENLNKGDSGTIIKILTEPELHYEIEFKDDYGDAINIISMPDEIEYSDKLWFL